MTTISERYQALKLIAFPHVIKRKEKSYGPDGRRWGEHSEEAGAEGQIAGALWHGGDPDFRNFEYGDGGVDVYLLLRVLGHQRWTAVDFKGVWNAPKYLLVPAETDFVVQPETIYVQAYRPDGWTDQSDFPWPLNGWMWGHEVAKYPADYFMGNDRLVHMVPSYEEGNELRPMRALRAMYCNMWRHRGYECKPQWAIYPEDHEANGYASFGD